ncbi:MAG: cation:proton antiporter [Acidobacteriota bacterium]
MIPLLETLPPTPSSPWLSVLFAAAAPPFLTEAVLFLVAGAVIAFLCHRLGLVPIVGFLAAGVLIGPGGLGLVKDRELIDGAAELGVILLLFTIGIEFSLEKLASIKRLIFVGGGLQVGLTTAITASCLMAFGVDWKVGIFTGFLVSLSSTAIVLKLLGDRGETNTEPGKVALGFLIFQDLGIIVMVLLVPMLGGGGGSAGELLMALGKATALIVVVLVVARRLMPPLLERVAATCSPEIFLLSVVALCFGTAWLTSLAGVSVSLGAFLAGLMVSESRFSHHAFTEIMPLQILFSAAFFLSVGLLLDVGFLMSNLGLVLGAIAAVLVIKLVTTGVSALVLGYPLPTALASAFILAQVGEFSFVLERAGREVGLFPAGTESVGSQTFIAATVVLMVLTPPLGQLGRWLASRCEGKREEVARAKAAEGAEEDHDFSDLSDHVVLAGYGDAARRLASALRRSDVPFVITTLSPEGATQADGEGYRVLRGDASKTAILQEVGLDRARMLVIADDQPVIAHRITAVARSLAPSVRIAVRTRAPEDLQELIHAGADLAVSDELESTLELCSDLLRSYGADGTAIDDYAGDARRSAALSSGDPRPTAPRPTASSIRAQRYVDLDRSHTLDVDPAVCGHGDKVREVSPRTAGCEECLANGEEWVHLRMCMTCGHVGCCDDSPHQHARAHWESHGHPIMKSLEPGESWGWCFEDEVEL